MSTKIFNGFLFSQNVLESIFKDLHALRKIAKDKAEHLAGEDLVKVAVQYHDLQLTGLNKDNTCPLSLAWRERKEQEEQASKGIRTHNDYELSVTIIPHHKKGWMGLYYGENQKMKDLITTSSWYMEYNYWNNTDKPDELSEQEWKKREKDWNHSMEDGVPALAGMNVQICFNVSPSWDNLPQPETIETLSFTKRVNHVVTEMAVAYLNEHSPIWKEKFIDKNHAISNLMQMERELRKGAQSEDPEISRAWTECHEKAMSLLVKTPTLEMLKMIPQAAEDAKEEILKNSTKTKKF